MDDATGSLSGMEAAFQIDEAKIRGHVDQVVRQSVEETLNARLDKLTQYAIAVEGLGYPKTFDPTSIPNVRVMARRLRRTLENYYTNNGAADPIRIVQHRNAVEIYGFAEQLAAPVDHGLDIRVA